MQGNRRSDRRNRTWYDEDARLKINIAERSYKFESFSGDNNEEEIPVPIPNTEVKLFGAENTCGLPCWEDRKLPDFYFL